jgi:acyl carrier protein
MDKLVKKIENIFEIKKINLKKKFSDLKNWDSLTRLSIIAFLDSDYKIILKNSDLDKFDSIETFCNYVIKNKR